MNFEQMPAASTEKPKNQYEGMYNGLEKTSVDELDEVLTKINPDQMSWLSAKLNMDLEELKKEQKNLNSKTVIEVDLSKPIESIEPVTGEMGLNANELSAKIAQTSMKIEKVHEAQAKLPNIVNIEIPE